MFQQLKNIDTAFRHIRLFSVALILACVIICCYTAYHAYQVIHEARSRIYILSNGKVLEAFSAERRDNVPVEARDHVKMFHHYFFTLDPDPDMIQQNIERALYMSDESAKQQYDNLKESRYYSSLIAGNISQDITMDSIRVDTHQYPYYFRYYGKQRIIRATSIVHRGLVTEGYLRNVARTDHNAHGLLIEKWSTLSNRDLNAFTR